MKKLAGFIMVVFVLVAGCKKYNYPEVDAAEMTAEIKEGEQLFMRYCQHCHPDGEAGLGPSIYYLPSFTKRFQVRHGLGAMPAFKKDVISNQDLKRIKSYLKYLKDKN
jgi:mono/diheme cytochrome c family protein